MVNIVCGLCNPGAIHNAEETSVQYKKVNNKSQFYIMCLRTVIETNTVIVEGVFDNQKIAVMMMSLSQVNSSINANELIKACVK